MLVNQDGEIEGQQRSAERSETNTNGAGQF